MRNLVVGAGLIGVAALFGAAAQGGLDRVAEARQRYDLELARELFASLNGAVPESQRAVAEHARSALLVAELERIDFEDTPRNEGERRREIGARIDEAARRGLDLLELLDESSETSRMRADLIGTLIRSKFRGKRYKAQMERAAARAIELDPRNAKAHVSAAKPSLLRPGRDQRDLDHGLVLIDQALEIDPDLETALLLRGRALWELGRTAEARQDWQRAVQLNPHCTPAARWLEQGL